MREIVDTVRQGLALVDVRLRRRWLLLIPWALFSAVLEMIATGGMLVLIRLVSDPAGAQHTASLNVLHRWIAFEPGAGFNAALAAVLGLFYLLKNGLRMLEAYAQQRCAAA